jgi:hypothetical protein
MSSRAKGARGELEAAALLVQLGFSARRTVQYNGLAGGADLETSCKGVHFEVKRTERLSPYQFMDQAVRDSAKRAEIPCLLMRSNNRPWLVTIRAGDLHEFVARVQASARLQSFDGPEAQ